MGSFKVDLSDWIMIFYALIDELQFFYDEFSWTHVIPMFSSYELCIMGFSSSRKIFMKLSMYY